MELIKCKSGLSTQEMEIEVFRSEEKGKKYLYLIAGVHGDEPEGIYLLNEIRKFIDATNNLDLPLIVIPILNIDGHLVGSRQNAHGVDLNRNFPTANWIESSKDSKYYGGPTPLSEPENQLLVKLFEKFKPGLIISFHSFSNRPMINYSQNCHEIATLLSEHIPYPLVCDTIEGHPTPGSLGEYTQELNIAPLITFETRSIDEGLSLKEIASVSLKGFEILLESDLLKEFIGLK